MNKETNFLLTMPSSKTKTEKNATFGWSDSGSLNLKLFFGTKIWAKKHTQNVEEIDYMPTTPL